MQRYCNYELGIMKYERALLMWGKRSSFAVEIVLNMENYVIDDYLNKPCWVIDILPQRVPANGPGRYFEVEEYYLREPQMVRLCQKFADILLKLYCYDDLAVSGYDDEWLDNPSPEVLVQWVMDRKPLHVLLKTADAMIVVRGDDLYMSLYGADEETLRLVGILAAAEGLFVWKTMD